MWRGWSHAIFDEGPEQANAGGRIKLTFTPHRHRRRPLQIFDLHTESGKPNFVKRAAKVLHFAPESTKLLFEELFMGRYDLTEVEWPTILPCHICPISGAAFRGWMIGEF